MFKKLKSLDLITLLLFVFLAAIPLVIFTVKTLNENIRLFSQQSDTITKLKLLDKDFHYFASQQGVFSNYDEINTKIASFQQNLTYLKSIMEKSKNQNYYLVKIEKIAHDFQRKTRLLEKTKSYNSIIINSLNYLHDLEKNIRKYSALTDKEYMLLDDTLFMSLQFYTNNTDTFEHIKKNLTKIKYFADRDNDNYLIYFYRHESSLVKIIADLKKEKKLVHNLHIYSHLDTIYKELQKDFKNYLFIGKSLMITIMLFLGSLLVAILYLHRKSIEQKKELGAYKYAIENSDNSIVITNLNKEITFVNEAFERDRLYKEGGVGTESKNIKIKSSRSNTLRPVKQST